MVASRPKAGSGFARSSGFTMIELMMTIAIATVVMTLAIPSFRYVTNSNRIAGEINGLLGDMQFARSEAIKEGRSVTVCVSTDGTTCSVGNTDWKNGWIVFAIPVPATAPPNILRVQTTLSGTDTFLANNNIDAITFNREGYAGGLPAGTLITLHTTPTTDAWTRCLSLTFTGQMTTQMVAPTNTCT
jgi:type IV fimbrial biogenesis protein FimT